MLNNNCSSTQRCISHQSSKQVVSCLQMRQAACERTCKMAVFMGFEQPSSCSFNDFSAQPSGDQKPVAGCRNTSMGCSSFSFAYLTPHCMATYTSR